MIGKGKEKEKEDQQQQLQQKRTKSLCEPIYFAQRDDAATIAIVTTAVAQRSAEETTSVIFVPFAWAQTFKSISCIKTSTSRAVELLRTYI